MISIQADMLPDESLDSWLELVADLNGCAPRHITGYNDDANHDASRPLTRTLNDITLHRISDNTGMSPNRLARATLRRYESVGLSSNFRDSATGAWSQVRGTGYCPSCLNEHDLRWELPWHLRWINICQEHHLVLRDNCPSCGLRARDTRTHHPRTTSSRMSPWRLARCTHGCATEILAHNTAHAIEISSAAYRAHEWVTEILRANGAASAYTNGEFLSAESILTDASLLTRHALYAMTYIGEVGSIPDSPDPGRWTQKLTEADFVNTPLGRSGVSKVTTPQFLIAQTAAINILTTASSGRDLCDTWLSPSRITQIVDHLRRTEHPSATVHLERLLSWRRPPPAGTVLSDSLGRRRTQHSARALTNATTQAIDAMSLPACIWRQVRDNAPQMPERVTRLLPLTAPIALAAMGRKTDYRKLGLEFGFDYDIDEIRYALNHLVSNEHGTEVFSYLKQLHTHLLSCPPPIDYRRRRRIFPAPSDIGRNHTRLLARAANAYLTEAFTWKIQRYIWQLLTGGDPLVTYGAALLHGPAAYSYRKFVLTMPADLQDKSGEVAQRLLLKHRIGEPTSYTPQFSAESGTWAARGREEHYLRDIGRSDLRRTSLSLTLAASTAGDPEEFVHLALSGEMVAALRLCRFTETALCAWDTEAAATLGIRSTQISRECAYLSKSLGTEIFTRRMPNGTRELTPTGTALYNLARANIDKLRQVANYEPPCAD